MNFYVRLSLSVVTGLAAFYVASFFSLSNKLRADEKTHPVSVVYKIDMYSEGQLGLAKWKDYARFADGSIVSKVTETFPTKKPPFIEIMNATTGEWRFLDPVTQSATTLKKSPEQLRAAISDLDSEGCPENVDVTKLPEAEVILGHETVYYIEKSADGNTYEKWMVPDLNCLPLKKIETSSRHAGAHNEQLAISMTLGEPAETLRRIPAFYTERNPSEVEQKHMALSGGEPFWGSLFLRRMTKEYAIFHP